MQTTIAVKPKTWIEIGYQFYSFSNVYGLKSANWHLTRINRTLLCQDIDMTTADEINTRLQALVGLKLSIARRAADLRNFQFGQIRKIEGGTVADYALHIQCPWRIEGPEGIVTGRSDLWRPADPQEEIDWDNWDYSEDENLQDRCIGELLGGCDSETRSFVNATDLLVVEMVEADRCGGAVIALSGGYRLVLFPAGTQGENWRLFQPKTGRSHFVVSGGRIESDERKEA